jgi:hypothetical protein
MTQADTIPQQIKQMVLAGGDVTCEDSSQNPVKAAISTIAESHNVSVTEQYDISDLYSTEEDKNGAPHCLPFLHYTAFIGPQGEVIRVKALFDEGAMMSVMCASVFNNVKHRLGNWTASSKRLCMANGAIVQSEAVWKGEVVIGGI